MFIFEIIDLFTAKINAFFGIQMLSNEVFIGIVFVIFCIVLLFVGNPISKKEKKKSVKSTSSSSENQETYRKKRNT